MPFTTLPLMVALTTSAALGQSATPTPKGQVKPTAKPAAKPVPKVSARDTAQMVARVLKETSEIRGLPVKRSVPSGVKSQQSVEKMIEGMVQSSATANQVATAELYLQQLGLAPANFNLKSYYVKMMGEQIAGYYDNKAKAFYTSERVDPTLLESVMAHELTHALQDQHFNLERLSKWPPHDSDARVAMQSLVEGDATLVMSHYIARNPMRYLGALAGSLKAQGDSQILQGGPRILRESMTFPYIQGMMFASNLHRRGGYAQVSAAFKNLPQSSEQILHFEKYLAGDKPIAVKVRDLKPLLGAGWKQMDHDVNGELDMLNILAEYVKEPGVAQRAAEGWGGDRYTVYTGPKKAALIVQDSIWDSEKDALKWRQAYAKRSNTRFGIKPIQRGNLQVWNSAPYGVWMEQRGKRVVILEGTVGAFDVAKVMSVLWR